MQELKFISQLDDEYIIWLINMITSSARKPGELLQSIITCDRNHVNEAGEKCISVTTGRGRHALFNYEFTDTSLVSYFAQTRQKDLTLDQQLQEYLIFRFGDQYEEYLAEQTKNKKPIVSTI